MSDDLALMSAVEMLRGFADGRLSPVEVTQAALKQVKTHDGTLNAFVLLDEEAAVEAARQSEARWQHKAPLGRLDGVPTTIKDIVLTKGWPTLRGSAAVDPAGPWREDAPATARLREHGAVLLGKTTTPEFGWKGVTDSPVSGITRNPWDPSMTPGGSSGGAAAAAAAGMGALHVGTDGGGSIRIPCGFTGIPGIKATFGRVPAWPLSPFGTVSHVGPMARTVADCALMLTVMAEPDARDPYALPYAGEDYTDGLDNGVQGLKLAYFPSLGGYPVDPEVARLVDAAARSFEDLGALVEQPELQLPDLVEVFKVMWCGGAANLLRKLTPDQEGRVEPGLREIAQAGAAYSLYDYLDALAAREALTSTLALLQRQFDLLLLPSLPITAFEAGREVPEGAGQARWWEWTPFTWPFNLTGQPAASVPCGLAGNGLPVGLQLVGRRYDDALVLRAAQAFEARFPPKFPRLAGAP